jgi:hypothetical protein
VNLDGITQVSVPRGVPGTTRIFIAEGAPSPVVRLSLTSGKIGPARKILVSTAISNELEESGPEIASDVIGRLLAEDTTRSYDAVVFDTGADDGIRPAGLLHAAPTTTPIAGGGLNALTGDLKNLVGMIADAGVGTMI